MPCWEGTPHRLPQQQKHPLHLLLLLLLWPRLPHPRRHLWRLLPHLRRHLWRLLPHLRRHLWRLLPHLHLHLLPNLQFRLPLDLHLHLHLHLHPPSRWLLGRCSHRWSAA